MHGLSGFGKDIWVLWRREDAIEVGLVESLTGLEQIEGGLWRRKRNFIWSGPNNGSILSVYVDVVLFVLARPDAPHPPCSGARGEERSRELSQRRRISSVKWSRDQEYEECDGGNQERVRCDKSPHDQDGRLGDWRIFGYDFVVGRHLDLLPPAKGSNDGSISLPGTRYGDTADTGHDVAAQG